MTDNRTTDLQSLSKLKMAGKLHYWRGTVEIPETELHAICDEIQAEHDQAVTAALGRDAYDAVAEEHVITADGLRDLLAEWDKHPGRNASDEEMVRLYTQNIWPPAIRYHRCENCGAFFAVMDSNGDTEPNCCPNCRRRAHDLTDKEMGWVKR